jgi:hypothetical protein
VREGLDGVVNELAPEFDLEFTLEFDLEPYGTAGPCCWNNLDLDAALSRLGRVLGSGDGAGEGGRMLTLSSAGVTS